MRQGRFVVLEGIDGAGTTTQLGRVAAALAAGGQTVHTTSEPSRGPIGTLLRRILAGELAAPGEHALALLFASDRADHLQSEVVPKLQQGVTVLSDRYYHSSLAYQSLRASDRRARAAWLREINRFARVPDLTLVFDLDQAVAAQRRAERGDRQLYDSAELQRALAEFYGNIEQVLPGEAIAHICAGASMQQVTEQILGRLRESALA
ncbi:MAG: dTMP kinase [Proteobacteria bacterium]|nr:dTMP kinase [Pseudomonadota bacterium]